MSKTRQLALPLETHCNHYLFSDHFLNQVLPGQHVWRESEAEARQALDAIAELYSRLEDALPHYNEAALEQEWIRPILDVLGHIYHVQPSLAGAAGTPDYVFFADEPAKQAAARVWGTPAFWETALAVGDAKRWDRPLDKRLVNGAPDAFTNANPCFQINYYLQRTGRTWGVLSNGRRWRLYYRETSSQLDIFYEVDLAQLTEQGDLAAFRYFYLFFRAAAFRLDADGHCWLDEVLDQSAAYAVHVGDELKGRVYEALRLLAQGFLDYPTNRVFSGKPGLCPDPTTDLPSIHDGCLILLYRLLFLLYAESRGLLPLDNPSYAGQYSLKAIKEDIAHKTDAGVVYLAKKATLWDDLRTLFEIIYSGQESLGVPAYDGRLFDPARYPFLEERTIGDKYLAQAIDLLARAEAGPGQGLSFVDYRDLSIRHLGSIYEGLLEYRLAYATEEMAVVKRGKKEEIVPASEAEKPGFFRKTRFLERIPARQVYLVTDRGERKATGSYYTPDYIVKYIVEQTLGPLADSQAEAVEKEVAALKAKNKGGARRTQAYKDELSRLQNSFADRVLALNTLDPAMGSGHFLVEATDYLARRIVEAGVATEALAKGDEESELSYWRRRVVERCIYGVDLNPLAVELAKLSLWLATVARGKPLSFLDHHLRCGNSLIGARVADLQALPVRKKQRKKEVEVQQLAMWDESAFTRDMYLVVGAMRQIGEYETANLVSVKEKERLFEETVERERRKWRTIADLWTATYFGLELTPQLYNACVQYVQGQPVLLQAAQAEALLDQAHEIWGEKQFFHWEIEFPEVFFDDYGQHKGDAAGFDAVVGNPPYVLASTKEDPKTIKALFELRKALPDLGYQTLWGRWDIFVAFAERALMILRQDGYHSFIVSNSLEIAPYAARVRQMLLNETTIRRIDFFPNVEVFPGIGVRPTIYVVQRCEPSEQHRALRRIHYAPSVDAGAEGRVRQISAGEGLFNSEFAFALEVLFEQDTIPLGKLCYVCSGAQLQSDQERYRGEFTKDDLISNQRSEEFNRPYVEGKDLQRWSIQRLRYVSYDLHIAKMKRPRFRELFENPKIMFSASGGGIFDAQSNGHDWIYANHTVTLLVKWSDLRGVYNASLRRGLKILNEAIGEQCHRAELEQPAQPHNIRYLLSLCNSNLLLTYARSNLAQHKIWITEDALKRFPIRRISFTTPPEERERLVGEGLKHEEREMARMVRNTQNAFAPFADFRAFRDSRLGHWLAARLSADPEQSDVVHDLLAHLAGRMIEMHKKKQDEVRGFLDWLAEYTGRPVEDWALKTNLQCYYEQDWTEMGRILKRNQRKLPKVDLDVEAYKNEPAARIRAAWETSMETLRPLLARIEATDRLIDRIVYQLYGLTKEEIAVVEAHI